jgi:hypothetical protein
LGCAFGYRLFHLLTRKGWVGDFILGVFASELFVGEPPSMHVSDGHVETISITKRILRCCAIVVTECLFIDVAEQVKGLNLDVGPVQTALKKTPEIFNSVGMDLAANILNSMVDDFMLKIVTCSRPTRR